MSEHKRPAGTSSLATGNTEKLAIGVVFTLIIATCGYWIYSSSKHKLSLNEKIAYQDYQRCQNETKKQKALEE